MNHSLTFEAEPFDFPMEKRAGKPCQCSKCRSAHTGEDEIESGWGPVPSRRSATGYRNIPEEDTPVRANFVDCERPSAAVAAITGPDPVGTIRRANRRAIELLDNAIIPLRSMRNSIVAGAAAGFPTVSDNVGQSLLDRFGLDANNRGIWTGTGARSVLIFIRRLLGARQILADGWMRYTCLGNPTVTLGGCLTSPGNGCPPDRPNRRAVSCGGHSRIVLCRAWCSDSLDDQAATLLHECIHIYFGFIRDAGNFANAHCYEHLVLDLNGLAPQAGFEGACA
jgi:hypothetical protein